VVAIVLVALLAGPVWTAAAAADIAVVVRPDTPAEDLTLSEIRRLLLGERQFWNSALRVTLLISAPATRERDVVLRTIYHMSESEFKQFWISKVFRAEASSSPRVVLSNEQALELVNIIPGAVAFVDAARAPKGVKVLKIDGKVPGEKGYPLK
jgi:hypothetical protein